MNLFEALESGDATAIEHHLDNGGDINILDHSGNTLLGNAVRSYDDRQTGIALTLLVLTSLDSLLRDDELKTLVLVQFEEPREVSTQPSP